MEPNPAAGAMIPIPLWPVLPAPPMPPVGPLTVKLIDSAEWWQPYVPPAIGLLPVVNGMTLLSVTVSSGRTGVGGSGSIFSVPPPCSGM